nr:SDR family NAD(P)-dependent oxidoreductase [Peribacillus frigoritolerans]
MNETHYATEGEQNKGSVINASSIAGLIGAPGHVLYGASKGAVRTMTKDAATQVCFKRGTCKLDSSRIYRYRDGGLCF